MTVAAAQENNVVVRIEGFDKIIFNKKELKSAIRKGGVLVKNEARRLIAKRAISNWGDFPGYDSGVMSKSIAVRPGSFGGYVKVMPFKTPLMGKHFYPAYLYYGTSRGLKPRKNFMIAALDNKQAVIRASIHQALKNALQAQ